MWSFLEPNAHKLQRMRYAGKTTISGRVKQLLYSHNPGSQQKKVHFINMDYVLYI
jgi:hypothetical protein